MRRQAKFTSREFIRLTPLHSRLRMDVLGTRGSKTAQWQARLPPAEHMQQAVDVRANPPWPGKHQMVLFLGSPRPFRATRAALFITTAFVACLSNVMDHFRIEKEIRRGPAPPLIHKRPNLVSPAAKERQGQQQIPLLSTFATHLLNGGTGLHSASSNVDAITSRYFKSTFGLSGSCWKDNVCFIHLSSSRSGKSSRA